MKSIKKNNNKRTFNEVAKDTLEYMYSTNVLSMKRTDKESLENFTNMVYESLERNEDIESKTFLIKSEIMANSDLLDTVVDDILQSEDCENVVKSAIIRYTCKNSAKADLSINQVFSPVKEQVTRVSYVQKGDGIEKIERGGYDEGGRYGYVYRSSVPMGLCEDEDAEF